MDAKSCRSGETAEVSALHAEDAARKRRSRQQRRAEETPEDASAPRDADASNVPITLLSTFS